MSYAVDLTTAPEVGEVVNLGGQDYACEVVEPYTRKDGTSSTLISWRSDCAECGAPFVVQTGMQSKAVNRRCSEHHHPGRKAVVRHG